ncbi:MAG: DTW domain-containing protein [Halobacteriovoraceae bacterium]|jgi:DTW domain-containing protein|nr:DTW domain-containing protein [Halobacteriovoraceae bacterium]
MNKEQYLKQKKQYKKQQNDPRTVCKKCLRPSPACFCAHLSPFKTETKFCFLMHPLEAKPSQIGTGRMSHIALINSHLIIDTDFDQNQEFLKLLKLQEYNPYLLYPGDKSLKIDDETSPAIPSNKKLLIFILDGTWPCAKKMMKKTTKLHQLPKISFSTQLESQFSIKHQPAKYCLSTIESVHYLLGALEKHEIEKIAPKQKASLLNALNENVLFHQRCAADPNNNSYARETFPYKEKKQRVASKKWETRSICYRDETS